MLPRLGQLWGSSQLHIAKNARATTSLMRGDKRRCTCRPSELFMQDRGGRKRLGESSIALCSASTTPQLEGAGDHEGGRSQEQHVHVDSLGQFRDERDCRRMLLVDANALVYRAYFGFQYVNLSAKGRKYSSGEDGIKTEEEEEEEDFDTSSLFGFLRMLLMLLEIRPLPKYVSVVFDSKTGRSFRQDLYPEYKANRENKTPQDLKEKLIPQVLQVVKALQLNTIELNGYEADDVIASLSKIASEGNSTLGGDEKERLQIDVASPDKDFFQILGPSVRLLRPIKKKKNGEGYSTYHSGIVYEAYTENTFMEEYQGLSPEQFIDIQALAGDSADNVPGVKGVGPKTAVKLLRQFGTLDGIIAGAADIKGKVAKNALTSSQGVDAARLSKQLVTLDCNIEKEKLFDHSLERDMVFSRPDDGGKELLDLFRMYDFQSLIPRIEKIWEQLEER